ncbi:hypothetical protein [Peribacillus asahii]|uniref:hypothetical protein n=1 Tax=Peribacillus asahii TaxID=228899 RepID=UPI00207A91D5|nr:hypothetical protein [Peribacillus asahii]USK85705.1 hypothetical protein LIT35_03295 [Peribacillus asahii]
MKQVEVMVSPDAEEFYLACSTGWVKVIGHLIEVDGLQFSAVPIKDFIRVSEVESGAKLFDIFAPETIESYEETLMFLEINVAANIVMLIEKAGIKKVQNQINLMKEAAFSKHGQKPTGQKVDTEWMKADISDVLN